MIEKKECIVCKALKDPDFDLNTIVGKTSYVCFKHYVMLKLVAPVYLFIKRLVHGQKK